MKRLAGVSTEVDLGECISHLPPPRKTNNASFTPNNFKINLLPDEVLCYFHWALESHEHISFRSGSIIMFYRFLMKIPDDQSPVDTHSTLSDILETNRESITAQVELADVDRVSVVLSSGLFYLILSDLLIYNDATHPFSYHWRCCDITASIFFSIYTITV